MPLIEAPRGIATKMIACEYLVAISAKDHPLAGRTDVPLSAFRDEPFVDFEQAWGTRQLVDTGFRHAGIERRVAFEVNDLGTLIELVARGLGVALVPEAIAEGRGRNARRRPPCRTTDVLGTGCGHAIR